MSLKLHLGCGMRFLPGWYHVDVLNAPHVQLQHEIDNLPMIADNSADEIYTCHALEHFHRRDIPRILREWNRILRPGGIIRIAVPDFEAISCVYAKHKKLSEVIGLLFGRQDYLYNYHYTAFDYETLKDLLETTGFINIDRYDWRSTDHATIHDFSGAYLPHMDLNTGTLMSLNIKAEKPNKGPVQAMATENFNKDRHVVTAFGLDWFVHDGELIDSCITRSAMWEVASTQIVNNIVKPGWVVADIGANIGYYTLLMAKIVGPSGSVIAFEPMDEAHIVLAKNCEINNLNNVKLFREGLSNVSELAECQFNFSWPVSPPPVHAPIPKTRTRVWRLDDLAKDYYPINKLDFVKIDVDGYEIRIMEGARETFSRLRPIMLVEICDYTLRQAAGAAPTPETKNKYARELLQIIADLHYDFYHETAPAVKTDIESILNSADLSRTSVNILCRPSPH